MDSQFDNSHDDFAVTEKRGKRSQKYERGTVATHSVHPAISGRGTERSAAKFNKSNKYAPPEGFVTSHYLSTMAGKNLPVGVHENLCQLSRKGLPLYGMLPVKPLIDGNQRVEMRDRQVNELLELLPVLIQKFIEKKEESTGFRDVFIAPDILLKAVETQSYFSLALDLLKFINHSSNYYVAPKLVTKTQKFTRGKFANR